MNTDQEKILKRKLLLKGQGIKILQNERRLLRERLFFLKVLRFYENRIEKDNFDPDLSRKIDCLRYLTGK